MNKSIENKEAANNFQNKLNECNKLLNKGLYFSNLMQIDPRYFEGSSFENNVNFFKINLRNGKKVILVDFIGYTTKSKP